MADIIDDYSYLIGKNIFQNQATAFDNGDGTFSFQIRSSDSQPLATVTGYTNGADGERDTITVSYQGGEITYEVAGHSGEGLGLLFPGGVYPSYSFLLTEVIAQAGEIYTVREDDPNLPPFHESGPGITSDAILDYGTLIGQTFGDVKVGVYTEVLPDAGPFGANQLSGRNEWQAQEILAGSSLRVDSFSNGIDGDPDTLTVTRVDASGNPLAAGDPQSFSGTLFVLGHDADGIIVSTTIDGTGGQTFRLSEGSPALFDRGTFSLRDPAPFGLPQAAVICFAKGTGILTDLGDRPVEELSVGDIVITASGEPRPIKWLGTMVAQPPRHPRPNEVNPVCIRAGAFGEGLPKRDLRVSPGHAVYVEGVLIPAGLLVNGASIVQEQAQIIRYFHVELDSHDVLLAHGLPCETYLDDGNRAAFANAEGHAELHGRLDPKSWDDACAPMVADGPQLLDVRHRLDARAEALGWIKSEDPDLVLVADGVEIAPLHASDNRFWFAAPAASALALSSNAGVLAHVMPGLGDGRLLSVAVEDLRVDGAAVALDDAAFGAGFYPVERHDLQAWRWTNGHAELVLPLAAPAMIEIALTMVVPTWSRQAPSLRLVG